jgi:hypothetical protein
MPARGRLLCPAYVHFASVGRKSVKFVLPRLLFVQIMGDDIIAALFIILWASRLVS